MAEEEEFEDEVGQEMRRRTWRDRLKAPWIALPVAVGALAVSVAAFFLAQSPPDSGRSSEQAAVQEAASTCANLITDHEVEQLVSLAEDLTAGRIPPDEIENTIRMLDIGHGYMQAVLDDPIRCLLIGSDRVRAAAAIVKNAIDVARLAYGLLPPGGATTTVPPQPTAQGSGG